jgi:hypothetical protein
MPNSSINKYSSTTDGTLMGLDKNKMEKGGNVR